MKTISRRDFSLRASLAAAAAPFVLRFPAPPHDAPKQIPPPPAAPSRAEELQKRADSQRNQLVSALHAKPLPLDLEPAFLFAAKPREKKRQGTKNQPVNK
jgi:hypothetical protein